MFNLFSLVLGEAGGSKNGGKAANYCKLILRHDLPIIVQKGKVSRRASNSSMVFQHETHLCTPTCARYSERVNEYCLQDSRTLKFG